MTSLVQHSDHPLHVTTTCGRTLSLIKGSKFVVTRRGRVMVVEARTKKGAQVMVGKKRRSLNESLENIKNHVHADK